MDLQSFRCPLGAHDHPPSAPLQDPEPRCHRGLRAIGGDGDGRSEQLRGQGRTPTGPAAGLRKRRCAAASPSSCPRIRLVSCTVCRERRCLLPVDGWFEWPQRGSGKQPYYLTLADGSLLSLAALWKRWNQGGVPGATFIIITTVASPGLEDLHHRQPAMTFWPVWERLSSSSRQARCGLPWANPPWRVCRSRGLSRACR